MCPFLKQSLWPKTLAWCELNLIFTEDGAGLGSCFTRITRTVSRKGVFSWRNRRGQVQGMTRLGQHSSQIILFRDQSSLDITLGIEGRCYYVFGLGQKEQSVFSYLQTYPFGRIIERPYLLGYTHEPSLLASFQHVWMCSATSHPLHFVKDLQLLLHSLKHVSEHF